MADITYIPTGEGWLYLTSGLDLCDRKVIGWALNKTMKTKDTVIAVLEMATINQLLKNNQELIFHSDRGIQYACDEFRYEVEKHPLHVA